MLVIMKNILKYFGLATMMLMTAVSCKEDLEETGGATAPIFPEEMVVNENVKPGDILEFTFSPNMDWVMSVPKETFDWFWINDNGFKVLEQSGKAAEKVTVRIAVSDQEELNEWRECLLTLTMGGESMVVARYVRPAKNKTLNVYACNIVDDAFETDVDGYVYGSEDVTDITMKWTGMDFRFPIKVNSNFTWKISTPEWLVGDIPEDTKGEHKFIIYGVPSKYPLETTTGKVAFLQGNEVVKEFNVTIPGCLDIFSYNVNMALTQFDFTYKGLLKSAAGYVAGPAAADVFGPEAVRVLSVGNSGSGYTVENPQWIHIDLQEYNKTAGADVLQNRTVSISVDNHEGADDRQAYVFFLPANVKVSVSELFEADGVTVKEEFVSYSVPLVQHPVPAEYLTPDAAPDQMALSAVTFEKSSDQAVIGWAGTDYAYNMYYAYSYSQDAGFLHMTEPFASISVYDSQKNEIPEEGMSAFWCSFETKEGNLYGRVIMDLEKVPAVPEAYFVFRDKDKKALAVMKFVYDPNKIPDSGDNTNSIKFTEQSKMYAGMVGATLEHLTEGDIYDSYVSGASGAPIYHLTYTMEAMPLSVILPLTVKKHNVNGWAESSYIRVNNAIYHETFVNGVLGGIMLNDEGAVEIYMSMPEGKDFLRGNINFTTSDDTIVAILVCTLDLRQSAE